MTLLESIVMTLMFLGSDRPSCHPYAPSDPPLGLTRAIYGATIISGTGSAAAVCYLVCLARIYIHILFQSSRLHVIFSRGVYFISYERTLFAANLCSYRLVANNYPFMENYVDIQMVCLLLLPRCRDFF